MALTGYLSLPLELRQKILHDALEDATDQDIALNVNIRLLKALVDPVLYFGDPEYAYPPYQPTASHLYAVASNLIHVHPTIKTDLPFVLE